MDLLFDMNLESDSSNYGVSSYAYMRTPEYTVEYPSDSVGPAMKKRNGWSNAFSAARQRQLSASARLDNFDLDFYPDQFDNMVNNILDDERGFDSESNILHMLDNLQVSEDLFSRRNLAALEAQSTRQLVKEARSTRQLAKLLTRSAARKEAMLALARRNVSRLNRSEMYGLNKMNGKDRGFVDRKTRSSQLCHSEHTEQKGVDKKRQKYKKPQQKYQNRKRRLCRHFLKGHCKRGNTCDFLHDSSIFCHEMQKVFLGRSPPSHQ